MKNKSTVLAAVMGVVAFVSLALAGVTGYGSFRLKDNPGTISDSGGTTRITIKPTNPQLALNGTLQLSRYTTDPVTGTAAAVGMIAVSSNSVVYVSTSTTGNSWVKVGSQ